VRRRLDPFGEAASAVNGIVPNSHAEVWPVDPAVIAIWWIVNHLFLRSD
jgi:hypothetical protein